MKRHRIFIAINLEKEIKNILFGWQEEIKKKFSFLEEELGRKIVKPVGKENFHITIEFLGYLEEKRIEKLRKVFNSAVLRINPFLIHFNEITYSPSEKQPRLIWVKGEKSENLSLLRNRIRDVLRENEILKSFENQGLLPHITLFRIKQWEWRMIDLEERPEIKKNVNLEIKVNSFEIMESKLKRQGAEYAILEKISL